MHDADVLVGLRSEPRGDRLLQEVGRDHQQPDRGVHGSAAGRPDQVQCPGDLSAAVAAGSGGSGGGRGGASKVDGFAHALQERFGSPVEAFDPFRKIAFEPDKLGVHGADSLVPTVAVAVGLALRRAGDR